MKVSVGRKDIYIRIPALGFITRDLLVNEHKTSQPASSAAPSHVMTEDPRDEIQYSLWRQFETLGVHLAVERAVAAQTSYISEDTEQFSSWPNCATVSDGY